MSATPLAAPALLVDSRGAAKALAVSPRTLWGLTASGELPAVRIGRSVRYSVDTLRAYIARQEAAHKKGGVTE